MTKEAGGESQPQELTAKSERTSERSMASGQLLISGQAAMHENVPVVAVRHYTLEY